LGGLGHLLAAGAIGLARAGRRSWTWLDVRNLLDFAQVTKHNYWHDT
jgi:hypothetical protein